MDGMTYAYKFSVSARETKPDNDQTRLLEKALDGDCLNREEKDRIAEMLYGTFGSHGPAYRLAGWVWYMGYHLPRILVSFSHDTHGGFHAYYAPDKTSLRKALAGNGKIREMLYA